MTEWLATTWEAVGMVLLSVTVVYVSLIVFTRLAGLRSFSKMSGFDFAMTIALGSVFATTVVAKDPPVAQGLAALAGLYVGQVAVALARRRRWVSRVVDNQPRLLMRDGKVLHEALRDTRVTEDDLRARLREANVLRYEQVRAVVFETTGDISVLHGGDDAELDPDLLANVVGAEEVDSK